MQCFGQNISLRVGLPLYFPLFRIRRVNREDEINFSLLPAPSVGAVSPSAEASDSYEYSIKEGFFFGSALANDTLFRSTPRPTRFRVADPNPKNPMAVLSVVLPLLRL